MKTSRTLSLLFLLLTPILSQAATRDWTGNTSTDWFTAGNWTALPASGDTARLGYSATIPPTVPPRWPDYNGDNTTRVPFNVNFGQTIDAWHTNSGGFFTNYGRINLGYAAGITGTWYHNGGDLSCALDIQLGSIAGSIGYLYVESGNITNNNLTVGRAANSIATMVMNGGSIKTRVNFSVGYEADSIGTLVMNGGDITATGNLNIGSLVNATGIVALANCSFSNNIVNLGKGTNSVSTLTITNALLWCTTRFDLNNQFLAGAENTVIIGDGGILDTEGAEFYKGTVTLCTNGLLRVRKQGGGATPLNVRGSCPIDFVGGEMWIGTNYTATGGSPRVAQWIQDGGLLTTLPGASVLYNYDSGSGYTKIYAGVFPSGQPTDLTIFQSSSTNITLSWVDPTALCTLKTTTNLSLPSWDFVDAPATVINTTNFSLTLTNEYVDQARFFRLSYP